MSCHCQKVLLPSFGGAVAEELASPVASALNCAVGLGDGLYCGGVWNWSNCRLAITSACPVMRSLRDTPTSNHRLRCGLLTPVKEIENFLQGTGNLSLYGVL